MDWTQIIVGIVSSVFVGVLGKLLNIQMTKEQRSKLDWAIEKAVAGVALKLRSASGPEKKEAAIKEAESLAPKAMATLTDQHKDILVEATYAKLRSSLPSPTSWSMSGDELAHATDETRSKAPPPRDDEDTQP